MASKAHSKIKRKYQKTVAQVNPNEFSLVTKPDYSGDPNSNPEAFISKLPMHGMVNDLSGKAGRLLDKQAIATRFGENNNAHWLVTDKDAELAEDLRKQELNNEFYQFITDKVSKFKDAPREMQAVYQRWPETIEKREKALDMELQLLKRIAMIRMIGANTAEDDMVEYALSKGLVSFNVLGDVLKDIVEELKIPYTGEKKMYGLLSSRRLRGRKEEDGATWTSLAKGNLGEASRYYGKSYNNATTIGRMAGFN